MDFFDKYLIERARFIWTKEYKKESQSESSIDFDYEGLEKDCNLIVKGKRCEAIIGLILLIPPVLGIVAFTLNLLDIGGSFAKMSYLSSNWTCDFSGQGGGGMSAAPIFLGLMALAGVFLIKDNIKYLFSNK